MTTDMRNDTVAQLEEEIARLQKQQDSALAEAEKADHKLEKIHSQSVTLAPAAFSGDSEAVTQLEVLEAEAAALTRTIRVAKDAASELTKTIGATKDELAEARRELHRRRYEELLSEEDQLIQAVEEATDSLAERLAEHAAWHRRLIREGQHFLEDRAQEGLAIYAPGSHRIREYLGRKLGGFRLG